MVVGDDDIQPIRLMSDEVRRADTAVHGDEEAIAFAAQMIYRLLIESVTLCFTLGNIEPHLTAHFFQAAIEDGCRRDAIHIVVSINDDALSTLKGLENAIHPFLHAFHQERIAQIRQIIIQEMG